MRLLDWYQEREAFYILTSRIFLKNILADSGALKKHWPVDASEIQTMYLIAENLVNGWDVIKDELIKNSDPQRQEPADCNDVSTMGTVR